MREGAGIGLLVLLELLSVTLFDGTREKEDGMEIVTRRDGGTGSQ